MYTTNQIFLTDFRYPVQAFWFFLPPETFKLFCFSSFFYEYTLRIYLRNMLFKLRNVIKYCFIYLEYLISSITSFIDIFPVCFIAILLIFRHLRMILKVDMGTQFILPVIPQRSHKSHLKPYQTYQQRQSRQQL